MNKLLIGTAWVISGISFIAFPSTLDNDPDPNWLIYIVWAVLTCIFIFLISLANETVEREERIKARRKARMIYRPAMPKQTIQELDALNIYAKKISRQ